MKLPQVADAVIGGGYEVAASMLCSVGLRGGPLVFQA